MGQFKPMVKMMTTEPTVELKLKKGGHVKKAFGGQIPVAVAAPQKLAARGGEMMGKAPKKPSIMERRKSMNASMLMSKKGGDVSQDKAMIKKAMKQHDAQEHKGGEGTKLKLKDGGAAMDRFETKTTIEGNAGKFDKTKMHTAKKDRAHGTGEVKEGKPGGYATGGTIEGNEGKFKNTKMHDGDKHDSAHGTGGVRMANAGGFKHGGKIMHKAAGGSTNWENRPADSAKPGKTNTVTGGVKEGNAGGFKKGGAAKKHFATGGAVNDAGRAVAMPRKPVSRPVANSLQSGTFKKGGKVVHKADGGGASMPTADDGYDPVIAREAARRQAEESMIRRENEATPVMDSVKKLLGLGPKAGAGRGFVNPPMAARKTGGRAKC